MNLQDLTGISILGSMAALSWWLLSSVQITNVEEPDPRHAPDAWFINATTTGMNEFGLPHYQIISEHQIHFRDDDTSEHLRPFITSYREEGPPWKIHSDRAKVSSSGDEVLLLGDVFMDRQRWFEGNGKMHEYKELTTRNMLLRPDDDYAETDEEVFLVSESARLNAVGMRAYLNIDRVQFLSRVKSRHVTNDTKTNDPNS